MSDKPPKKTFRVNLKHNHNNVFKALMYVTTLDAKDMEEARWRAEWYIAQAKRDKVLDCRRFNNGQDCVPSVEEVKNAVKTLESVSKNT